MGRAIKTAAEHAREAAKGLSRPPRYSVLYDDESGTHSLPRPTKGQALACARSLQPPGNTDAANVRVLDRATGFYLDTTTGQPLPADKDRP
jgi:hypothetical protein